MNADTVATNGGAIAGAAGVGETVFLTGATGFLGSEILKRIIETHPRSKLALLVRSTARETARERVDKLMARLFSQGEATRHAERVEVVEGDISLRGAGMDSERSAKLAARIDHVIHCAASVRFDLPLDVARRDNTEGTRNILQFAERASAGRASAKARGKTGGRPRTDVAKLKDAKVLYENSGKTAGEVCKVVGVGRRIFFTYLARQREMTRAQVRG